MPIRAVFFDFGGVIMRTEYQAPRQKLAERFNMDYADMDNAVFGCAWARRASLGEIGEEELWADVLKRFKQPASETKSFHDQFFGDPIGRIDLIIVDDHRLINISGKWDKFSLRYK